MKKLMDVVRALVGVSLVVEDEPAGLPLAPADIGLEELLGRHVEARGGRAALARVETVRMTGTGEGSLKTTALIAKKRPDRYLRRFEDAQGGVTTLAAAGDSVWEVGRKIGVLKPTPVPKALARRFKRASDMDGALVDYQAKGHRVELLGKETLGSGEAWKLRVSWADADRGLYYLDATSLMLVRMMEPGVDLAGNVLWQDNVFQDFREAGGVQWPYRHSLTVPRTGFVLHYAWERVEVNVPLEDALFQMPGVPSLPSSAAVRSGG